VFDGNRNDRSTLEAVFPSIKNGYARLMHPLLHTSGETKNTLRCGAWLYRIRSLISYQITTVYGTMSGRHLIQGAVLLDKAENL
jgi:hypothetical protein